MNSIHRRLEKLEKSSLAKRNVNYFGNRIAKRALRRLSDEDIEMLDNIIERAVKGHPDRELTDRERGAIEAYDTAITVECKNAG